MTKPIVLAGLVACLLVTSAQAAIIGPVYPPPGGTSWAPSGPGLGNTGGTTWTYSALNPSQYTDLYWSIQSTPTSALNGGNFAGLGAKQQNITSLNPGQVILSGTTVFDLSNGENRTLQTRTVITALSGGSFQSPPVGMTGSEGFALNVNTAATSFSVNIEMQTFWNGGGYGGVNPTAGWYATNTLYNLLNTRFNGTQTSVSGGLWYEELEQVQGVPEPATLTMFGLGALGLGFAGYRRRKAAH
jgi:hypothetical protein